MKGAKLRVMLFMLVVACLIAVGSLTAGAQEKVDPTGIEYAPGQIVIRLQANTAAGAEATLAEQVGATRVRTAFNSDIELWRVPKGQEASIVEQLNADPRVLYAEPNYIYHAFAPPNDPEFSKQWAHGPTVMRSAAAWDITTGLASTTIAILDTGIDETHPDLSAKIVAGYDFVDSDANPHDLNGHGTHVAGIAAATTNNGVGVAGMNWNAKIMPVRVLDAEGSGTNFTITNGINWAYANGAQVLNLSLGGPSYSTAMQNAVSAAHAAGSLVVAAMGNDNIVTPFYPAAYDNVLAVSATAEDDSKASYSNFGAHCDVAAPGGDMSYLHDPVGIYSSMPTYSVYMNTEYGYSQNYDFVNGTSQASPYVAGLAALVWAAKPTLTPDQMQTMIESTAVDLGAPGPDPIFGHGRIDALGAVQALATPTLYPVSNNDGDGDYLVDWSDVAGATSYILEESPNPGFGSPATVYSGPTSQHAVSGQADGTWFYRARAHSMDGDSGWSVIRSVMVGAQAVYLPFVSAGISTGGDLPVNGDFESGPTAWTEYSSNGFPLILDNGWPGSVTPHSGSWAAWLGGALDEISYIQQQVTVPPGKSTLGYWYWIASEDVCGWDSGGVIVNGVVVDVYDLCGDNNTGGWVKRTVNLSAYAGQSVSLKFQAETDDSFNSNLFIDDVLFQSATEATGTGERSGAFLDSSGSGRS